MKKFIKATSMFFMPSDTQSPDGSYSRRAVRYNALRRHIKRCALSTKYVFAGIPQSFDFSNIEGIRKYYINSLQDMGRIIEMIKKIPLFSERGSEEENMELWVAAVLLVFAVLGIVLSARLLKQKNKLRVFCMAVCILAAFALTVYIGLTVIFVYAVQNQPPTN